MQQSGQREREVQFANTSVGNKSGVNYTKLV